jgi:hypothetical protein
MEWGSRQHVVSLRGFLFGEWQFLVQILAHEHRRPGVRGPVSATVGKGFGDSPLNQRDLSGLRSF